MTKQKLANMLKEARDLLVRQSYTKTYDNDEVHELTSRINLAVTEWCLESMHKETAEVVWTWRQGGWCEATGAEIHLEEAAPDGSVCWSVSSNAPSREAAKKVAARLARSVR